MTTAAAAPASHCATGTDRLALVDGDPTLALPSVTRSAWGGFNTWDALPGSYEHRLWGGHRALTTLLSRYEAPSRWKLRSDSRRIGVSDIGASSASGLVL